MSLKGVEDEFRRLADKFKDTQREGNKKVVSNMVKDLQDQTPVDTGRARASWETHQTEKGIAVENTTEYIQYLNEGSSKQAPARFIESVALKYGVPVGIS